MKNANKPIYFIASVLSLFLFTTFLFSRQLPSPNEEENIVNPKYCNCTYTPPRNLSTNFVRKEVVPYTANFKTLPKDKSFSWGGVLAPHDPDFVLSEIPEDPNFALPYTAIDRKLRICIVVNEFPRVDIPYGGLGIAYYELARLLLSQGHAVRVLVVNENVKWKKKTLKVDDRQLPIDAPPPNAIWVSPDAMMKRQMSVLEYFQRKPDAFDIIHFHEMTGNGHLVLLAKSQGWAFQSTKLVVSLHGPFLWTSLGNHKFPNKVGMEINYYEQKSAELADIVISPSNYLLQYLKRHGWTFPEHTFVIQNLFPHEYTDFSGRPVETLREIVFFGKLSIRKGYMTFLRAVERLGLDVIEKYSLSFTFLGPDSLVKGQSAKGNIIEYITRSDILSKIQFSFVNEMSRDDALNYLKNSSRLAVIPSLIEHAPYTISECIMNRINFIASNVGGIPELINEQDRDAVLFPGHILGLKRKILSVLEGKTDFEVRPAIWPRDIEMNWVDFHKWLTTVTNTNEEKSRDLDTEIAGNPPSISLCITTYNRPDLLKVTLTSLLDQSYSNFQVGIVDDGSSEETVQIIKDDIIPFLEQNMPNKWFMFFRPNCYLGSARNYCAMKLNDTKYLTFLDDDDVPKPNYFDKLVKTAEFSNSDVVSSFFHVFKANPLANPLSDPLTDQHIYAFSGGDSIMPLMGNVLGGANIFMKRQVFDRLRGFTTYKGVGFEDYEFLVKAKLEGFKHTVVPDPILFVRNTEGSMMKRDDHFNGDLRVLSNYMDKPQFKDFDNLFLLTKGLMLSASQQSSEVVTTPSVSRRVLVNSVRDFSGLQGRRNWFYGFRRYARSMALNITKTVFSEEGHRWIQEDNTLFWPYIDAKTNHPSVINHKIICAVRRWVSWEEGVFTATITSEKSSATDCGDGVDLIMIIDGKITYKRVITTNEREQIDVPITIRVGSKVDIVVDPKKSDACDATTVELEIWSEL